MVKNWVSLCLLFLFVLISFFIRTGKLENATATCQPRWVFNLASSCLGMRSDFLATVEAFIWTHTSSDNHLISQNPHWFVLALMYILCKTWFEHVSFGQIRVDRTAFFIRPPPPACPGLISFSSTFWRAFFFFSRTSATTLNFVKPACFITGVNKTTRFGSVSLFRAHWPSSHFGSRVSAHGKVREDFCRHEKRASLQTSHL
jgi:hypothetical protein